MIIDLVGLPSDRHEEDPVTEQRDDQAGPQQAEVTVPQWRKYSDLTGPPRGHVGCAIAALWLKQDLVLAACQNMLLVHLRPR